MKMVIEFDMDNDAFREWPGHEAARILEDLRPKIAFLVGGVSIDIAMSGYWHLRDFNGNIVGFARITEDETKKSN